MKEERQIDKPLHDLIDIIHFTEKISAKIHGVLDEAQIFKTVKEESARSKKYNVTILLLTEDGSKLKVAEVSIAPGKLKEAEKATGLRLKKFTIKVEKSTYYRQVVREGKTVQANVDEIVRELLPKPKTYSLSNIKDARLQRKAFHSNTVKATRKDHWRFCHVFH